MNWCLLMLLMLIDCLYGRLRFQIAKCNGCQALIALQCLGQGLVHGGRQGGILENERFGRCLGTSQGIQQTQGGFVTEFVVSNGGGCPRSPVNVQRRSPFAFQQGRFRLIQPRQICRAATLAVPKRIAHHGIIEYNVLSIVLVCADFYDDDRKQGKATELAKVE